MPRNALRVLVIAFLTLLAGSLLYFLTDLEISQGLDNLFQWRGTRKPPAEVVVVAMDEKSEERLGVNWKDYTAWRKFHTQMVQELQRQGARLMIFDLQFIQPQPDIDPAFAATMRNAGNVLVTECVTKRDFWSKDFSGREQCSIINKPTSNPSAAKVPGNRVELNKYPPTPVLAAAVLDHAPFYLPDDAKTPSVHETWAFINQFNEAPTLPVAAWFHYLQRTGILQLNENYKPTLSAWLAKQRQDCLTNPAIGISLSHTTDALEKRINDLLCQGDGSYYVDFYGPPRTLRMVSYSDVYDGKVADLKDKVVFIGKANLAYISGKTTDVFHTPFTTNQTGQMFGVEIMATVFANLLEGRDIYCPIPPLLILAVVSLCFGMVFGLLPVVYGFAASLVLSGAYLAWAMWGFVNYAWWLPVPSVLVQLAVGILMMILLQVKDLREERQRILEFVSCVFPKWVSFVPARPGRWHPAQSAGPISVERDVYGLCLATDIEGYTAVAAQHTPHEMWVLLNAYYQVLGHPVSTHNGVIADVTGDAMMAVWTEPPITNQRLESCLAALEIEYEVSQFNETSENDRLPTRIGLHEGDMVLGSLATGKGEHFRAIGDTVNTASRIQGVNKYLGTKILASSAIVENLSEIAYRPVGKFILQGKDTGIELVEIVGLAGAVDESKLVVYRQFTNGLNAFQQGNWKKAIADFEAVLKNHADDGPSRFYLNVAMSYQQKCPAAWAGEVTLEAK